MPCLQQVVGGAHVHHLGRAGIADRAGAAHEQDGVLVDAERGVVDAAVVVLRAVEDDGAALEALRVVGVGQVAVAELLGDHARLHDRGVEQVAGQHEEAGALLERAVERADDVLVLDDGAAVVSPMVLPLTVRALLVDQALLDQLADDGRHAAGVVDSPRRGIRRPAAG